MKKRLYNYNGVVYIEPFQTSCFDMVSKLFEHWDNVTIHYNTNTFIGKGNVIFVHYRNRIIAILECKDVEVDTI